MANLSNWIQAGAAICLVILSAWTLKVLRRYAKDTKRIADDSSSQVERSQMPFLAVVMKTRTDTYEGGWVVENQGFGPAMNICRTRHFPDRPSEMQWVSPLAPGADGYRMDSSTASEMTRKGFIAEYQSLSGKRYRTKVDWSNGEMHTEFEPITLAKNSNKKFQKGVAE